jgi:asparagine synthase (glutamine-hydrolysing)
MCGIVGVFAKNDLGKKYFNQLKPSLETLNKRGPDDAGIFVHNNCALGHKRLSIIDTSSSGHQPFTDSTGRWTIVFNGEFFNFLEEKLKLQASGINFHSASDTEVLLQGFIQEGETFFTKVNGFFAVAIYDAQNGKLTIARDRFGVKPLHIFENKDVFLFASEVKALLKFRIEKSIDKVSLLNYFHFNYLPDNNSIFRGIRRFTPGKYAANDKQFKEESFYQLKTTIDHKKNDYFDAQNQLKSLLTDAVRLRLNADVPLGCFLSGGIDSSIITGLAAKEIDKLYTFSIGFPDQPHFDETAYAKLVAKKHKTEHTVFGVRNKDLLEIFTEALNYFDEPFADSSALNVFLLSRETRKHVTVALSGDGADEVFAGYNKHRAEWTYRHKPMQKALANLMNPITDFLPKSRNSSLGNKFRQISKFSKNASLPAHERYWNLAGFYRENQQFELLKEKPGADILLNFQNRKNQILHHLIGSESDMQQVLASDMEIVLKGDMLVKVDLMSMANSLEVRNPFLDFRVVDFAFSLPGDFKIDAKRRKKILVDSFSDILPSELFNRNKRGFEVPLLHWFKNELRPLIDDDLLKDEFIVSQGLFNLKAIQGIKKQVFSNNPDDSVAKIWGLLVFQFWWRKYYHNEME